MPSSSIFAILKEILIETDDILRAVNVEDLCSVERIWMIEISPWIKDKRKIFNKDSSFSDEILPLLQNITVSLQKKANFPDNVNSVTVQSLDKIISDSISARNEILLDRSAISSEIIKDLENIGQNLILEDQIDKFSVRFAIYGSSASGFASSMSDIDCSIFIVNASNPDISLRRISNLLDPNDKFLKTCDIFFHDQESFPPEKVLPDLFRVISEDPDHRFVAKELVMNSRVPVVKLVHSASNIDVDISIGSPLPLANTALLQKYSQVDDRVVPLVLAVKRWAKARNCGDARNSTLSSYAWVLLVINFLQAGLSKPILPCFQKNINDSVASKENNSSVGELFVQFFQFYLGMHSSDNTFNIYKDCASIRLGSVVSKIAGHKREKQSKESTSNEFSEIDNDTDDKELLIDDVDDASENSSKKIDLDSSSVAIDNGSKLKWRFCVEDPFEIHDLGKVTRFREAQFHILKEMWRVVHILSNATDLSSNNLESLMFEKDELHTTSWIERCYFCLSFGHNSADCPDVFCKFCFAKDHLSPSCPKKNACFFCGSNAHRMRDCPMKSKSKSKSKSGCYLCGSTDHIKMNCPLQAIRNTTYMKPNENKDVLGVKSKQESKNKSNRHQDKSDGNPRNTSNEQRDQSKEKSKKKAEKKSAKNRDELRKISDVAGASVELSSISKELVQGETETDIAKKSKAINQKMNKKDKHGPPHSLGHGLPAEPVEDIPTDNLEEDGMMVLPMTSSLPKKQRSRGRDKFVKDHETKTENVVKKHYSTNQTNEAEVLTKPIPLEVATFHSSDHKHSKTDKKANLSSSKSPRYAHRTVVLTHEGDSLDAFSNTQHPSLSDDRIETHIDDTNGKQSEVLKSRYRSRKVKNNN